MGRKTHRARLKVKLSACFRAGKALSREAASFSTAEDAENAGGAEGARKKGRAFFARPSLELRV